MSRDFTYVDDIVEGVINVIDNPAVSDPNWDATSPDPSSSSAPYKVYNIGNNEPVKLMDFIEGLEKKLGKVSEKNYMDMQPGDVQSTYADVNSLIKDMDYKPETTIEDGISEFVDWYNEFYKKD
jgi:UDP-glucuronate 4-epimerase